MSPRPTRPKGAATSSVSRLRTRAYRDSARVIRNGNVAGIATWPTCSASATVTANATITAPAASSAVAISPYGARAACPIPALAPGVSIPTFLSSDAIPTVATPAPVGRKGIGADRIGPNLIVDVSGVTTSVSVVAINNVIILAVRTLSRLVWCLAI